MKSYQNILMCPVLSSNMIYSLNRTLESRFFLLVCYGRWVIPISTNITDDMPAQFCIICGGVWVYNFFFEFCLFILRQQQRSKKLCKAESGLSEWARVCNLKKTAKNKEMCLLISILLVFSRCIDELPRRDWRHFECQVKNT